MAGDNDRVDGPNDDSLPEGWEGAANEPGSEPLATEELALDEDERLPWLESSDDEYEDEGSDTGRMMGFLVMGLLALGLIVGGIWWATHRTADSALADGSLIAAPSEPYKTAPSDAGGKTFAGTGDSSFAVSEGQTRPAQLATGAATPAPAASGAAKSGAAPAAVGGVGVQVGAFGSSAAAETGWSELTSRYAAVLSGAKHRVVPGPAEGRTVYRLQAVAADAAAANALCSKLKAAGGSCQVK